MWRFIPLRIILIFTAIQYNNASSIPSFSVEPVDTVAVREQTARFDCVVGEGVENAAGSVRWRKDGGLLALQHEQRRELLSNGSLLIHKVRANAEPDTDAGHYQCQVDVRTAAHHGQLVSRRARLRIAVLHEFDALPMDQQATSGDTVLLPCRVEARPLAQTEWFRDGELLDAVANAKLAIFPDTGSLEIRDITAADSGRYHCRVSNAAGERTSDRVHVRVAQRDAFDFLAPSFVHRPEPRIVTSGQAVVLECVAHGHPVPTITWLKDGQGLKIGGHFRQLGVSGLFITSATATDGGNYTCRAENSQDKRTVSTTLEVLIPPTIFEPPESAVATEAERVGFRCRAKGHPQPTLTWLKDGEVLRHSQYFMMQEDTLTILGLVLGDAGFYQCLAENVAGSAQAAAFLKVERSEYIDQIYKDMYDLPDEDPSSSFPDSGQEPSKPLDVSAVLKESRYVQIRWRPPLLTNGEIKAYSVLYKQLGQDRERTVNATAGTLSSSIVHLEPETTYEIRVVAYNAHGAGPSSDAVQVTTKSERAVPGRVRSLTGQALTPTSARISWQPPQSDSTSIDEYRLFYALDDGKAEEEKEDWVFVNEDETEIQLTDTYYNLHGLSPFSTYTFRVEAHNRNGAGITSDIVRVRTLPDRPSDAPSNVTADADTSKSVTVYWQAPARSTWNGELTGYKLKYRKKMRGARVTVVQAGRDARRYTITGLTPGETYVVRIATSNSEGDGPFTSWVPVTTYSQDLDESQVPPSPMNMQALARSTSILLTWLPPSDSRIMVRGYMVGWGVGVPDVYTTRLDRAQRNYVIEDLEPNREYVISLKAHNNVGMGFPVYETVRTLEPATTAPDTPLMPPLGLHARTLSQDEILLRWMDTGARADEPNDYRMYTVRYSSGSVASGQFALYNTSETSYTVAGLRPNTQYEFSVRLVQGTRASDWSMAALNTTMIAKPSSAPRDVTVIAHPNDPSSALLNWQPPRDANGPITGYLIFYTANLDLHDSSWRVEGVLGDRMSTTIDGLETEKNYFFKLQARNSKGYGPLSVVVPFHVPKVAAGSNGRYLGDSELPQLDGAQSGSPFRRSDWPDDGQTDEQTNDRLLVAVIGGAAGFVALLALVGLLVCVCRRGGRRRGGKNGYMSGVKRTGDNKPPPDLWIHHEHLELKNVEADDHNPLERHSLLACREDVKLRSPSVIASSIEPPRYESTLAGNPAINAYANASTPRLTATLERSRVRASSKQMVVSIDGYSSNGFSGYAQSPGGSCTDSLSRSYYHPNGNSNLDLPTLRQQHHGKPTGFGTIISSTANYGPPSSHSPSVASQPLLVPATPPPPPSTSGSDHSSSHRASNPLSSFTALPGPPPPSLPQTEPPRNRPVPVTITSGLNGVPPSPRAVVNPIKVTSPSPLALHRNTPVLSRPLEVADRLSEEKQVPDRPQGTEGILHSYSTEELNNQIQNLDSLMADLKHLNQFYHDQVA